MPSCAGELLGFQGTKRRRSLQPSAGGHTGLATGDIPRTRNSHSERRAYRPISALIAVLQRVCCTQCVHGKIHKARFGSECLAQMYPENTRRDSQDREYTESRKEAQNAQDAWQSTRTCTCMVCTTPSRRKSIKTKAAYTWSCTETYVYKEDVLVQAQCRVSGQRPRHCAFVI